MSLVRVQDWQSRKPPVPLTGAGGTHFRGVMEFLTVEIEQHGSTESLSLKERPYRTMISEKALHWMQTFHPRLTPRRWGYRLYAHDIAGPRGYYARPWALWAILRVREWTRLAFWAAFGWLYRRGVFHLSSEEGMMARWRDVRPGPAKAA